MLGIFFQAPYYQLIKSKIHHLKGVSKNPRICNGSFFGDLRFSSYSCVPPLVLAFWSFAELTGCTVLFLHECTHMHTFLRMCPRGDLRSLPRSAATHYAGSRVKWGLGIISRAQEPLGATSAG